MTEETDLQIIKQLYNGNHLSDTELDRAVALMYQLNAEMQSRGWGVFE